MEAPNPSSLRVLIRPSPSTPTSSAFTSTTTTLISSSTNSPDLLPSSSLSQSTNSASYSSSSSSLLSSSSSSSSTSISQSRSSDGVVVVGFIGKREEDLTQLLNRILDYNVFGSGNLDKKFHTRDRKEEEGTEGVKSWFQSRRISYYYEEEKGIVFLQFVPALCPNLDDLSSSESSLGLDSILEQQEYGDLQAMLLMFSVCHVIMYLQEGSRFDTQILKKFRILQAAKHALVPYMKSLIKPALNPRVSTSSAPSQTPPVSLNSSKNASPGRGGGSVGRHSSSISLMSGLGSYSSLFPGQCTPVILFVFLDDFPESPSPGSHVEDSVETSSTNQSLNLSGLPRASPPVKGSSSVVMLSRPMSKSEGGFRKKLQSSLEAQIRFLFKKCRTLAGSDGNHSGSRGGGNANSAPLFSLEASRAVALLDRFTNQRGESLEFATRLVEEVLNAKLASDTLLLESHYQGANKEDIQSIKEFIYRQSDTLRGRGGLVTNTNSGSASGVGMVAVAAAAAAASAASGKPLTTPELPTLDNWLSSSQLIWDALLSVRHGALDESEITQISKRKPVRRNAASQVERIPHGGIDPLQSALSWLESGKGLNMKFSTSWCQRSLPAAKELYLKNLPECYPTSLHEAQLDKALRAFQSKVKGHAVPIFTKKLEDECISIWRSGRQLCDAVSLTGKPCMHQRHNIEVDGAPLGAEIKPHSSGFVFLHACACGRSRRLRDDPFDLETANITFNCFPNCHDRLPALQLPEVGFAGPIRPASWSLIRVGGARYYEPSKGLLQSGFCSTEKFLLKWTILLEKQTKVSNSSEGAVQEGTVQEPKVESVADKETKEVGATQSFPGEAHTVVVENQRKHLENISSHDKKISFGRGFPNFNMRRPFSEVVAGSVATDAAFPPLQQRKQPTAGSEKSVKQRVARNRGEENVQVNGGSKKCEDVSSAQESSRGIGANGYRSEPFLQIGSNVVPVSMTAGGKTKSNIDLKHVVVYFGIEHECPLGHRFLLTSHHLNELGSLYSLPEKSHVHSSMKSLDRKADSLNFTKSSADEKVDPHITTSGNKARTWNRSNQTTANGSQHLDRLVLFSESGKEHNKSPTGLALSKSIEGLEERLEYATLDDSGSSLSLLNTNLPIYMNCPHCRSSKSKKEQQKIKFSSSVSQLQRIFLVTPPFPTVLATCPVVQFEASCLPPSIPDCERQSQFSIGCRVILPPDSFLTLRLPFVYGVQLEDRSLHSLHHLEHQPELTAWINGGTILQIMSKGGSSDEEVQM